MLHHHDLQAPRDSSLGMRNWIRRQTFGSSKAKTLRRLSSWEMAELILKVNQGTFHDRLAADPSPPSGLETDGPQRCFSLEEVNTPRRRMRVGQRAVLVAMANLKDGDGKSATALNDHRALYVDFDTQPNLAHSRGLSDASKEHTIWDILARDLIGGTTRMNRGPSGGSLRPSRARAWARSGPPAGPLIDVVPYRAAAALVRFASAQHRHLNPDRTFLADGGRPPVHERRVRGRRPPQPLGPGLPGARLHHLLHRPARQGPGGPGQLEDFPAGKSDGARSVLDARLLLTPFKPGNELRQATREAFGTLFEDQMTERPTEHAHAVEQSGRLLAPVHETDRREVTRETWRRARRAFDLAYEELRGTLLAIRDQVGAEREDAT